MLFRLKKEILPHATTWMKFENIMLSEISQSQKDKCCIILLLGSIQHKLIGTESRKVVGCQGLLGGGNREWLLMDVEFQRCKMK